MRLLRPRDARRPAMTRPAAAIAAAAAAVFTALVTLDVLIGGPLRHLDGQTFAGGLPPRTGARHWFWRTVVNGGQYWLVGGLAALAALLAAWRRRDAWLPVRAALWLAATELAVRAGQLATARTPPRTGHDLLFQDGYLSYPSGHAANAAACLPVIALLTGAGRAWTIAAHALAIGVAAATVALGYHWPTDALAGWALGVLSAALARLIIPGRRRDRAAEDPPAP
ncbi:phosphatase PAP2 family protein [Actinomadura macrotermitis]|uniref:Phosphatidic acid phosphatase type 2/haloperoxidase domain-containing protein n=1 Tax=Actinomadura macrotermitis TaxID=2585200 RepID=A0A7K0C784_9ACTN|nr:phosphatase PAP2 family protein [Actinomadura macrotermitis]MQY08972.1 hypothetical protein [Actinomadura macrotermitis]